MLKPLAVKLGALNANSSFVAHYRLEEVLYLLSGGVNGEEIQNLAIEQFVCGCYKGGGVLFSCFLPDELYVFLLKRCLMRFCALIVRFTRVL